MNFTLYPIHSGAHFDGDDFTKPLPIDLLRGSAVEDISGVPKGAYSIAIEDISGPLTGAFDVNDCVSANDAGTLNAIRYAIVDRFDASARYFRDGNTIDEPQIVGASKVRVRNIAACLRLIRPMRQINEMVSGTVREDGSFNPEETPRPPSIMEVPANQKLFTLRNQDADDLVRLTKPFLEAMEGEFWKFRMAVEFHEAGHFQHIFWKARYSLWASAIEALYTTQDRDHRGGLVAKERIKWLLGEKKPVYPAGELSKFESSSLTVGNVVDELYELRNFIAHGERVPDQYYTLSLRDSCLAKMNKVVNLVEVQSFIIRKSLLEILERGWLTHFADAAAHQSFFISHGLTKSALEPPQKRSRRP